MTKGTDLARDAPRYLGIPYSTMDCQRFVEKVLSDCGIRKDLPGSNAWYRLVRQNGWVGSPEECRKKYGSIPVGAFLFILEQDGREPEKYKADGLGNASHIGLYTGMTNNEMASIAKDFGNKYYGKALFGSGAINSSSSRGMVCTSKFEEKTIHGGWNIVGLWNQIGYGYKGGKETMYATVVLPQGANGNTVNMRDRADRGSPIIARVPVGATVEVLEDKSTWCQIGYNGWIGWMMSNYLEYEGQAGEADGEGDLLTVAERKKIDDALAQIDAQLEIIRSTLGRG